jgi:hypothetical protein
LGVVCQGEVAFVGREIEGEGPEGLKRDGARGQKHEIAVEEHSVHVCFVDYHRVYLEEIGHPEAKDHVTPQ